MLGLVRHTDKLDDVTKLEMLSWTQTLKAKHKTKQQKNIRNMKVNKRDARSKEISHSQDVSVCGSILDKSHHFQHLYIPNSTSTVFRFGIQR